MYFAHENIMTYWDQLSHADRVRIMGEAAMAAIEHKRVANLGRQPKTTQSSNSKSEITGWIYTPARRPASRFSDGLDWRDRMIRDK